MTDDAELRELVDRERGILTKQDRIFLLGGIEALEEERGEEYADSANEARRRRQLIRDRVRNALLDFSFLVRGMDDSDMEQIVETADVQLEEGNGTMYMSMLETFEFLYRLYGGPVAPFELGIERAWRTEYFNSGFYADVDVELEINESKVVSFEDLSELDRSELSEQQRQMLDKYNELVDSSL